MIDYDEYGNDRKLIGINYYPKFIQLWDTQHKEMLFNFEESGNVILLFNYIDLFEEIQL